MGISAVGGLGREALISALGSGEEVALTNPLFTQDVVMQKLYDTSDEPSGVFGTCYPFSSNPQCGMPGSWPGPRLLRSVGLWMNNLNQGGSEAKAYMLDDGYRLRLLADCSTLGIRGGGLPFMTSAGTVLLQNGNSTLGPFQIYRVSQLGVVTLVYNDANGRQWSYECWAESSAGLFAGYRVAGDKVNVLKSIDDGVTWTVVYNSAVTASTNEVKGMAAIANSIFVGVADKIHASADGGATWTMVYDGDTDDLPPFGCEGMLAVDNTIYAVGHWYIMVCPDYRAPTAWYRIIFPYDWAWATRTLWTMRTPREVNNYISVVAVVEPGQSRLHLLVSEDGFYSFRDVGFASGSRCAVFQNALYMGETAIHRAFIPSNLNTVRNPLPRRVLRTDSLAALGTSTSFSFEPALGTGLDITIEQTYHAAAAAGGQVALYSSRSGYEWDTQVIEAARTLAFTAGATRRETYTPGDSAQRARFLKVVYTNLDTTYAITNIRVYCTLKV